MAGVCRERSESTAADSSCEATDRDGPRARSTQEVALPRGDGSTRAATALGCVEVREIGPGAVALVARATGPLGVTIYRAFAKLTFH